MIEFPLSIRVSCVRGHGVIVPFLHVASCAVLEPSLHWVKAGIRGGEGGRRPSSVREEIVRIVRFDEDVDRIARGRPWTNMPRNGRICTSERGRIAVVRGTTRGLVVQT